jgi:hypothetical protein
MDQISFEEFLKVDIRVGRVVRAEPFPEARKPSLRLWIDFGPEIGERRSSAQIAANYRPGELVGRFVLAVVKLPATPDRSGALRGADARRLRRFRRRRADRPRCRGSARGAAALRLMPGRTAAARR